MTDWHSRIARTEKLRPDPAKWHRKIAETEGIDIESSGYFETMGRGVAQGAMGLAGGAGSVMRWAGDVSGIESLSTCKGIGC